MLRVSDFCRSPLSEPRCLTKDHHHRRHRNGNGSNTIDGTESYDYHEEEAEEDDSFVVPVTLRIYSASLPAASSSSSSSSSSSYYQHESSFVRVPLTVLKDLALSDGDYAFIEKVARVGIIDVQPHVENSERLEHPRYCDKNTATTHNTMMGNHNHNQIPRRAKIRRKIVVRLILMDEAEEEEVEIRTRADMKYTVTNNCICVPTTVMTNLGLSPEAYWNDQECGNSCSTGDDINNTINNNINRASTTNTFFQLRAIYDNDSNTEDDESSLSNTCSSSSRGHPCETNQQRKRRRRIAGHVLLRPLGRQDSRVLPCFPSLRNHRHRHRHHHQRNDTITKNATRSDNASSANTNNIHPNNEEYSKNNATKDRNENNEDTVVAVDDDEDTYNWIFPSRSGIVLQESVLFEVRYHDDENNNGNNEKTTAKVCYYEILKVQPKDDHHPAQERYNATTNYDEIDDDNDDNDDTNDNDKHDNDEYFYITSSLTKFELDSEPISSLQFVRRLPPKPSCLSSSLNTSSQLFFHPPNNNNNKNDNKSTAKDDDDDDDDDDYNLYNNNHEESKDINHDSYIANNPANITISSFSRNVSGEIPKTPSRLYNNNEVPSNSGGDVSCIVDNNSLCVSPPHPDWKRVAEALIHAPTEQQIRCDSNNSSCYPSPTNDCTERATTATTHILHLIGTDRDHHLRTCVEIAARQVGMSYLSIRGLAAFGYDFRRRQQQQQQQQQNKSNSSITTTGTISNVTVGSSMIEQQLAGIDCAKEHIRTRRMEPCVLHFNDIDDELSSCDAVGDDALRCQIEDRLWTKWIEVVTPTASTSSSEVSSTIKHTTGDQQSSVLNYCFAPRVLIVISTSRPFTKKGPWLERLVFPSITLSSPNDKYIRYLWKREYYNYQHNDCDVRYFSNGNADIDEENNNAGFSSKATGTVSTFYKIDTNSGLNSSISKKIMELLRGRPAEEIVQLRRQLLQTMGSRNIVRSDSDGELLEIDDSTKESHLEELCEKLDSKRRKLSSALSHISNVSWDDVGGLDHVRTEIMDAIELPLKYPQLFPSNSGRSGILLFGPPGTGKTLVAKAVANECGLPFLSVKGPELLGSYVGESEANIRNVFESARKAASTNLPTSAAILFFDEMDSLAPRRDGNAGTNNGGGVMERVVASLLSELDGTNGSSSGPQGRVFVLGATNRPDLLDSSLLRPGRLDRLVYLGVPTERKERMRILVSQLSKMRIEHPDGGNTNSGAAAERMASLIVDRLPPRLSGADMSKLASGSMLHAIRRLCNEAEDERKKLQEALQEQEHEHEGSINNRMNITIDEVLKSWGEEKCTPVITLDDLYKASKDVSPSISDEEMNRYEQLRIEHCTAPVPAFN